jgi:hemolysin activation/secretion protein
MQTRIGYSKRTFSAQAAFNLLDSKSKSGRNFSIDGNLNLQQPIGGELSLDFTLKGTYQWNNNLLTLQADVSDVAVALELRYVKGVGVIQPAIQPTAAA